MKAKTFFIKILFLFLLFIIFEQTNSMIDYCITTANPKNIEDCLYFSTINDKCCFNNISRKCVTIPFNETIYNKSIIICEEDYFFSQYKLTDKEYDEYSKKPDYCTFKYNGTKYGFKNDEKINETFESSAHEVETRCTAHNDYKIIYYQKLFLFFSLFSILF